MWFRWSDSLVSCVWKADSCKKYAVSHCTTTSWKHLQCRLDILWFCSSAAHPECQRLFMRGLRLRSAASFPALFLGHISFIRSSAAESLFAPNKPFATWPIWLQLSDSFNRFFSSTNKECLFEKPHRKIMFFRVLLLARSTKLRRLLQLDLTVTKRNRTEDFFESLSCPDC